MPRKSLRTVVELNLHAVSCPGVWLSNRQDVYLTVSLFGQYRRTQYVTPIFPLLFHEKFRFDKFFYTAIDPSQVAECLEDYMVYLELIQVSDLYPSGRLLATYESNARDFLYPYPSYSYTYGSQDREVLMDRTIDFPGISPKLEFSTTTTIREFSPSSIVDTLDLEHLSSEEDVGRSSRSSRRRSRSRQRSTNVNSHRSGEDYSKPTLASIYRSRSPSPALSRRLGDVTLDDDDKPPFVVRKVGDNLITRTPGTPNSRSLTKKRSSSVGSARLRSRSLSPTRARSTVTSKIGSSYDDSFYFPRRYSPILDSTYYSTDYLDLDKDYLDWEYDYVLRRYVPRYRSYRYPYHYYRTYDPLTGTYYSPVSHIALQPSLSERFEAGAYSPPPSDKISERVDRAIRTNRSFEGQDLDSLSSSYNPSRSWRYYYNKYLHEIDDVDLELRRARLRRYYP